MSNVTSAGWLQFAAAAIKFVFVATHDPIGAVTPIVMQCFELVKAHLVHKESDYEVVVANLSHVNEELLRRFLSLLGHVAANLVAFLEIKVMNTIKAQKQKKENEAEAKRASKRAEKESTSSRKQRLDYSMNEADTTGTSNTSRSQMAPRRRANGRPSACNSVASAAHSEVCLRNVLESFT